ncbi:MAG: hypothetical protein M1831_007308 [Alyxoria varia]|nr:MAG: hypothetical protein M1831_007308 [Alyxoria varia]
MTERSPPDSQAATDPKPISCSRCRYRKIKCDKVGPPCCHCQKAGAECVFPGRVRAPRRKKQRVKARDSELLTRISRLESLLSKTNATSTLDGAGDELESLAKVIPSSAEYGRGTATIEPSETDSAPSIDLGRMRMDDRFADFVKVQESGERRVSKDFWPALSDEFQGLRQLLEDPGDSEDEVEGSTPGSGSWSTEARDASTEFIFGASSSQIDLASCYPSDIHRSILFHYYFSNVSPVCRILHKTTAFEHILSSAELIEQSTRRYKFLSIEACSFAMYFAVVTSMSDEDCRKYLNESRDTLVARFKRCTEVSLAEANFLNSMEIVTLQALTLYVTVLRTHDSSRSSWALVGLTVRLAHALNLHNDGDGSAFSAHEAEMRRRLWWFIIMLDMRASEDRCTEPVINADSHTTRMPHNMNDEDFALESTHQLPDKSAVTDMSFNLIAMDVSHTSHKMNFIPAKDGVSRLSFAEKHDIVKACISRIQNHYLAGCDLANKSNWILLIIGRLLILKLWSRLYYPLQSRASGPQNVPKTKTLRLMVETLEIQSALETNEVSAQFFWLFHTYVPWHALAIALAELCVQPNDPLADRAWQVINSRFKQWGELMPDGKNGMLWRPVRNLYKKAVAARERHATQAALPTQDPMSLDLTATNSDPQAPHTSSTPFPTFPNFTDLTWANDATGPSDFDTTTAATTTVPDPAQDLNLPQDFDTLYSLDSSNMSQQGAPGLEDQTAAPPINWDYWNEFICEAGAPASNTNDLPLGSSSTMFPENEGLTISAIMHG